MEEEEGRRGTRGHMAEVTRVLYTLPLSGLLDSISQPSDSCVFLSSTSASSTVAWRSSGSSCGYLDC